MEQCAERISTRDVERFYHWGANHSMKYPFAVVAKTKNFMDGIQRLPRASLRSLIFLMIVPALLSACFEENSKPDAGTWTLHSGVVSDGQKTLEFDGVEPRF